MAEPDPGAALMAFSDRVNENYRRLETRIGEQGTGIRADLKNFEKDVRIHLETLTAEIHKLDKTSSEATRSAEQASAGWSAVLESLKEVGQLRAEVDTVKRTQSSSEKDRARLEKMLTWSNRLNGSTLATLLAAGGYMLLKGAGILP